MKRKRKSPIRHSVKAHVREGYRVSNYVRGKGSRVEQTFTSRRKILKTDEARHYVVLFKYGDGTSEELKTIARSPMEAVLEADELRVSSLRPTQVIVKNQVGKILKKLGKEALKALRWTIIQTWKAGREASIALARYVDDKKAERLIREAYSKDPGVAISAKVKLKRSHPVYYELAFMRPTPKRLRQIYHEHIISRHPDITDIEYVQQAKLLSEYYKRV